MGRKQKNEHEKLVPVSSGLPEPIANKVKEFAINDRRTFAQAIRYFVEKGLELEAKRTDRQQTL